MSKWRSLYYLGKNTHDHGNFRATHRTPPFHNRHTHSTCFTETRMSARHQCETTVCPYKRTSKQCFLLTGITSVFATTADGFTFLLSQVFRRVNWRFCDLYSAVILRQGLLCSRSPLFNRSVWSGAVLSGLAISAPPPHLWLVTHCHLLC